MANRSASTRRAGAATSRSGQAVTVFSGNNFSVAGAVITASTTINLDVVTPGQSSANSIVTPTGGGGATLTSVTKTDSSYSPTSGNIGPADYFTVAGTGFDSTGNIYIGANTYPNVYYSSTELRVNLSSTGSFITTSGTYSLNYFTPINSKFGNYSAGLTIDAAPTVNYLVVAGGGGGGSALGGGGGAGGLLTGNLTLVSGTTYTITIGAGGAGGTADTNNNANGNDSTFANITATGGGKAGQLTLAGNTGGSGGGAGGRAATSAGGSPVAGQGYAGGGGTGTTGTNTGGGGGGGAGQAGAQGQLNTGGKGGDGIQSSITGNAAYYAGGGGGGADSRGSSPVAGAGGLGGGGAGTKTSSGTATSGNVNTGGGGGGGCITASTGGTGGSGVVILRTVFTAVSTTGSPTLTTSGGYKIYTFANSGTITF